MTYDSMLAGCLACLVTRYNATMVQVETGDCPHTLFYGPTGAGKKTLIMGLLRQIYGAPVERLKVGILISRRSVPDCDICCLLFVMHCSQVDDATVIGLPVRLLQVRSLCRSRRCCKHTQRAIAYTVSSCRRPLGRVGPLTCEGCVASRWRPSLGRSSFRPVTWSLS